MKTTTPSKLESILAAGHWAVTSECGPPRSTNGEEVTAKANLIKDHVDAINVTDNQTSVVRLCSLAACIRIKQMGLEPVLQMVTRDRNRIGIQSDILGAASFGINNILCLTGDHQHFGDHPQALNVFDLDSTQLIQTVKMMRELGIPNTAQSVASHYSDFLDGFVLDLEDQNYAASIQEQGIATVVTQTVMRTLDDRVSLARDCLECIDQLSSR